MKRILIDTDNTNGVKFEYYKFNDGSYGFQHFERFGDEWRCIGDLDAGWARDALEFEHSIHLQD